MIGRQEDTVQNFDKRTSLTRRETSAIKDSFTISESVQDYHNHVCHQRLRHHVLPKKKKRSFFVIILIILAPLSVLQSSKAEKQQEWNGNCFLNEQTWVRGGRSRRQTMGLKCSDLHRREIKTYFVMVNAQKNKSKRRCGRLRKRSCRSVANIWAGMSEWVKLFSSTQQLTSNCCYTGRLPGCQWKNNMTAQQDSPQTNH